MAEGRLTEQEITLVLRRAAELEPDSGVAREMQGLPVSAVEAAAAEVGLSPSVIRQAVAELRAGALDDDDDDYSVVCTRVVPAVGRDALDAIGRWLTDQLMVRARDRGTEQTWHPRRDWAAAARRAVDPAAALRMKRVDEVVVRAVETEAGVLVRVCVSLHGGIEAAPATTAGAGASLGAASAGIAQLLASGELTLLATTPVGAAGALALGFAGWRAGSKRLARHQAEVSNAIEGMLDEIEHGRRPSTTMPRLETWARQLVARRRSVDGTSEAAAPARRLPANPT